MQSLITNRALGKLQTLQIILVQRTISGPELPAMVA